jgi:CheY-like chemotaxis protein
VSSILLVDDSEFDVELTLLALQQSKLASVVEVARDGEEALAWIPRWECGEPPPAVILLDINMPRVDGLEVVRQLKIHPSLRVIPVVMLTSSSLPRDVAAAYLAGANSYIVKPVGFDQIARVTAQIESYWTTLNMCVH